MSFGASASPRDSAPPFLVLALAGAWFITYLARRARQLRMFPLELASAREIIRNMVERISDTVVQPGITSDLKR